MSKKKQYITASAFKLCKECRTGICRLLGLFVHHSFTNILHLPLCWLSNLQNRLTRAAIEENSIVLLTHHVYEEIQITLSYYSYLQVVSEHMWSKKYLKWHLPILSSQAWNWKIAASFMYARNTTVRLNWNWPVSYWRELTCYIITLITTGIWDWHWRWSCNTWLEISSRRVRARKCKSAEGSREAGDLGTV